jgi:hypothetical protein
MDHEAAGGLRLDRYFEHGAGQFVSRRGWNQCDWRRPQRQLAYCIEQMNSLFRVRPLIASGTCSTFSNGQRDGEYHERTACPSNNAA